MSIQTMEEAVRNCTPEEIWAMRTIAQMARNLLLMSDEITYTTKNNGTELDKLLVNINGYDYIYDGNIGYCNGQIIQEFPEFIKRLWLVLNEVVWLADGNLARDIFKKQG